MAHSSTAYSLATVSDEGIHWVLRRNCSVTPAQMGQAFALLSLLSLTIAGFFWFQGAVLVLPFAVLELTGLAVAFLIFARHASDSERISLRGGELLVEIETAGQTQRCAMPTVWTRVETGAPRQLVQLSSAGATVLVGRFVRTDLRPLLARELRQALRAG